jgi:hypothetical protein
MKKIYLGIIAALVSAISDILLLYHPNLISKYENYAFLFEIDKTENTIGWIIGMFFLPLLYLGYKGVKEVSDEDSKQALDGADWIVVFLIALGCVVHSIYHFLPFINAVNDVRTAMDLFTTAKLIEFLFVSCYLVFCTIVTLQSFKKKNQLLYANRFFNPLIWMILVAVIFVIMPKYGGYLAVSSFNMSIAFYFVGVLVNRRRIK